MQYHISKDAIERAFRPAFECIGDRPTEAARRNAVASQGAFLRAPLDSRRNSMYVALQDSWKGVQPDGLRKRGSFRVQLRVYLRPGILLSPGLARDGNRTTACSSGSGALGGNSPKRPPRGRKTTKALQGPGSVSIRDRSFFHHYEQKGW